MMVLVITIVSSANETTLELDDFYYCYIIPIPIASSSNASPINTQVYTFCFKKITLRNRMCFLCVLTSHWYDIVCVCEHTSIRIRNAITRLCILFIYVGSQLKNDNNAMYIFTYEKKFANKNFVLGHEGKDMMTIGLSWCRCQWWWPKFWHGMKNRFHDFTPKRAST